MFPRSSPLRDPVTVDALAGDPFPLVDRLRAREPVAWATALGRWLVTRRDVILTVLGDVDRSSTGSGPFTHDSVCSATWRVLLPGPNTADPKFSRPTGLDLHGVRSRMVAVPSPLPAGTVAGPVRRDR